MQQARFLESHSNDVIAAAPALVGLPLDITCTYRSGTAEAPQAIREASDSIESYSPFLDRDLVESPFSDIGDMDFSGMSLEECLDSIHSEALRLLKADCRPIFMGGEHTVALPICQAINEVYSDIVVVHADAHADLRDEYEGSRINHATVMRRIEERIGSDRLIQLGIRSGTREEFVWMRENNTILLWAPFADKALVELIANRPVYLTLDLDVLDPACMPGTGNPEAGGWFYKDLERLLHAMNHVNLVGADVVELNPTLDPSESSTITAAKIIRELLLIASSQLSH